MLVALLQRVKNEDGEGSDDSNDEQMESSTDYSVSVLMQFEQLTRELEVKVYTGLPSTETFKFLFGYLGKKAPSRNIGAEVESRQLKNHLNSFCFRDSYWFY